MPSKMPLVYEGDRPYIFVNYAHADDDVVLPIIAALVNEGYRVWWDDGIEPTTNYDEYLADHVYGCDCLVMFVSRSSLKSEWCTLEVRYALDLKKKVLPIYLEDVELTRGLQLRMGGKQALFWYEFETDEAFYKRLFKMRRLDPCLTAKGGERRGTKPRSARIVDEEAASLAEMQRGAEPRAARTVRLREAQPNAMQRGAEPRAARTGTDGRLLNVAEVDANRNAPFLDGFHILRELLESDRAVIFSETYGKAESASYSSAGLRSDS